MKTLTSAAWDFAQKRDDVEPLVVVQLFFGTAGYRWYGGAEYSLAGLTVEPRLKSISPIRQRLKEDGSGSISECRVELLDDDEEIRALLDDNEVSQYTASVLLTWKGGAVEDNVTLIYGHPGGNMNWSDADRTFSFDIVSPVKSEEVGYRLGDNEIDDQWEDAEGRPWPYCFGKPVDVPGLLVSRGKLTQLRKDWIKNDDTFKVVEGEGEDLFGSSTVDLYIGDGEAVRGYFDDDTFHVDSRNRTIATLQTGGRPSGNDDEDNPWVLWLPDHVDIIGKFVKLDIASVPGYKGTGSSRPLVNFCVMQHGKKCWFNRPWRRFDFAGGQVTWKVGSGYTLTVKRFAWGWLDSVAPEMANWVHKAGSPVMDISDRADLYVVNEIPSDAVYRVCAYRQLQSNYAGLEKRTLVPVPEDYYIVNLAKTNLVTGKSVTTIKFPTKLSMLGKGWEDGIFVTLESSVGSNVTEIIAHIVQTKTNLQIDADSFNEVYTYQIPYPAHCAVLDGPDAIACINDIAWQARCALTFVGNVVYIHYLGKEPTAAAVDIGKDVIRANSTRLEWSDRDDIRTVLTAKWRKKLSDEWNEWAVDYNVDLYGREEYTRTFWIYQHKRLVKKSARFWCGRMSRMWRFIRMQCFLPVVALDVQDVVEYWHSRFNPVSGDIFTRVHELGQRTKPHGIEVLLWLPVEAAASAISDYAYTDDSGDSAPTAIASKVDVGPTEVTRITPIPFSIVGEDELKSAWVEVIKLVNTSLGRYVVDVFPDGPGTTATTQASLVKVNTAGSSGKFTVGDGMMAFALPNGSFMVD